MVERIDMLIKDLKHLISVNEQCFLKSKDEGMKLYYKGNVDAYMLILREAEGGRYKW